MVETFSVHRYEDFERHVIEFRHFWTQARSEMNQVIDKIHDKWKIREKMKQATYLLLRSATKRDKASPVELDMMDRRVYQTKQKTKKRIRQPGAGRRSGSVCQGEDSEELQRGRRNADITLWRRTAICSFLCFKVQTIILVIIIIDQSDNRDAGFWSSSLVLACIKFVYIYFFMGLSSVSITCSFSSNSGFQ